MRLPLISICVPVYNGEPFLRQCLDSCLAQEYANFEIIVCDDGSNDSSKAILEEYGNKHKHLQVCHNEKNLGLVGNWNRCMELAKGEWIKFVFQDDYLSKNCLLEFSKRIGSSTQLIVSKRHFVLPEDASEEVKTYYSKTVRTLENSCGEQMQYSANQISKAALKHIGMNFIAEPSLTLFKKSVLLESGPFNPLLKQICDLEFMLRLASRYGLEYIPQRLCYFRIHQASATNANVSSKYFELKFIEPVLFSWLLLYSDHFKFLRAGLNVFQRAKLSLYFKLKSFKAARENERLKAAHPIFESSSKEYAVIYTASKGNWFIYLLDRLF